MKDSDKFKQLLDSLSDLLFRTWSAFLTAKNLDPVIESEDFVKVRYFLVSVYISCVESSLLGFSKLMSDKRNETGVGYLFNMCNEVLLPDVSRDKLSETVQKHRKEITELKSLIQEGKKWRDKAIAHLDGKFVNDPSFIGKMQRVNMEKVGEGFFLLQDLINVYRNWLDMPQVNLKDYEEEMTKEWEYLAELIKQNGE